jgi:prepilin-type N-terminal cleavage/methylation domain-containing protein
MNRNGFTLIEVLIVTLIMAVLASLTAQTINRSTLIKAKLQKGIAQQSAVRNALNVIERDLSLSFHYRDPNTEAINQIRKRQRDLLAAGQTDPNQAPPQGEPENLDPISYPEVTLFQGNPDRVSFTALSNVQTNPDQGESDQMEVSYYTESCRSIANSKESSTCIFRRTYHILDGNLDEGGEPVVILENVKNLRFRYFGDGKDDWVETWRSGEGADDATRGRFPLAVEIMIENEEDGKKVVMTTVAQLRFPNNPPPKTQGNSDGTAAP